MAKKKKGKEARDWYSVRMDTLRITIGLVLLLASGALAFWGFAYWNEHRIEQRATELVANARSLLSQLRVHDEVERHKGSFERGGELLAQAEQLLDVADYRQATEVGEESFQLLSDVLDQLVNDGEGGVAWFVSVEGDVQYRRGDAGAWVRAHARDFVYDGYYVRSASSASAELYFHYDETRFTIRPGTFFKVAGQQDELSPGSLGFMEYGYVDLDTSHASSGVTTRYSEITVSKNTKASVELEENSSESKVVVESGRALIRSSESGDTRELGSRQTVTQSAEKLGEIGDIPSPPNLISPIDNFNVDIDTTRRIQLRWEGVPSSSRYALQVSRSRLFGDTIIDTSRRLDTSATLGLRDIGTYVWRVAAFGPSGERGAWSEARKFRVESFRGLAIEKDDVAPPLDVEVLMNGRIAILRGDTEPGARVELNGQPLPVGADGRFSTSEAIDGSGATTLRFRAIDRAGNVTEFKKRVYLPE